MNLQEVQDWTQYYMDGGEIPDEDLQEILKLAAIAASTKPLDSGGLYKIIRGMGYTTSGQSSEIVDEILNVYG